MDLLFVILVAPLFRFWWQLLLGLAVSGAALVAIRKSSVALKTGVRLKWIVTVSGPAALWLLSADGSIGPHVPVPAFGAALDLFLLNVLLAPLITKLCRKTASSPPPRP